MTEEGYSLSTDTETEVKRDGAPEFYGVEEVTEGTIEEQEVSALDAFLSVDPHRPKEVLRLKIASLNTTITIRELDEREIDDIFERYGQADSASPMKLKRKGAAARERKNHDMNGELVARALVDPDLTTPNAQQTLLDKYGSPSVAKHLRNVMKPLELQVVALKVLALSGADDEAVVEAGN